MPLRRYAVFFTFWPLLWAGLFAQDALFIWEGGSICDTPAYRLFRADTFANGLDTAFWATYYPHWQTGADDFFESRTHDPQRIPPFNELQIYTDDQAGVFQNALRLEARPERALWMGVEKPFVSGMIHSRPGWEFTRGKIEVIARAPKGRGLWPAIWLFGHNGSNGGLHEIDLMELGGHRPSRWSTNLHGCYDGPGCYAQARRQGPDLSSAFHAFELEWTPFFLIWRLNGKEARRFPRLLMPDGQPVSDCYLPAGTYRIHPLFPALDAGYSLILNLAVSNGPFGGPPRRLTPWPAHFDIQSVHIWTHP